MASDAYAIPMRLSLIVLRSTNAEHLAGFYAKIGIPMFQERHGTGPLHFAGTLAGGVIEIYPTKTPTKLTFGIAVAASDAFIRTWIDAGGSSSPNGLLIDPDGNTLHLTAEV